MRIEKIEIENFRGFKGKHAVSFHPNLNVFVGVNGAGKSSVLDLIGIHLGFLIHEISSNYKVPLVIGNNDIAMGYFQSLSKTYFCDANNDFTNISNSDKFSILLSHELPVGMGVSYNTDMTDFSMKYNKTDLLKRLKEDYFTSVSEGFPMFNFPMFRYFLGSRLSVNAPEMENFHYLPSQFSAYEGVFHTIDGFEKFATWFRNQINKENLGIINSKNFKYQDPFIAPIREAINTFFRNFKSIKFENIRLDDASMIYSNINDLCVDKEGVKFNLSQLSNGEQTVLLIVADIAHRLSIASNNLKEPLNGKGIVLIDEIETHLHPEWQREVIPALTATFPNIQFFITTHSPQVLGSVDNQSVIIIENFEFKKAPHTKGRDSNSILTDVLGSTTRDSKYEKAFEELYDLIDNPDKVEEAKVKLRQMMSELGSNDTEIERAKMHFEFLTEKPV